MPSLMPSPALFSAGWIWVYITATTIRQGLREDVDNKALKVKLSQNRLDPSGSLPCCFCSTIETYDGRPLGNKLLYVNLPSHVSGPAVKSRVTVAHYKP